jgi:molecular chaperone GrpE
MDEAEIRTSPNHLTRIHEIVESMVTGYAMSRTRLERAFEKHELQRIVCVGERFDPERMEAVEVAESDRRSGEVIEEVRRGYLWRGRLFRYAQVRVAK